MPWKARIALYADATARRPLLTTGGELADDPGESEVISGGAELGAGAVRFTCNRTPGLETAIETAKVLRYRGDAYRIEDVSTRYPRDIDILAERIT